MTWYVIWLRRVVPQASGLTESVQSRIMATFFWKMLDRPMLLITAFLAMLGVMASLLAGGLVVTRHVAMAFPSAEGRVNVACVVGVLLGEAIVANVIVLPATWLTPLAVLFWVWPRSSLPLLRRAMWESAGIRVCERCGYDMRGSETICPECGMINDSNPVRK